MSTPTDPPSSGKPSARPVIPPAAGGSGASPDGGHLTPGGPREALAAVREFRETTVWARLRTLLTLALLAVLLFAGVSWAVGAVSEPFPETAAPAVCDPTELANGDILRPPDMTVSVLNAGNRPGLGGDTLDDLREQGFAGGRLENADDELDDELRVRSSQIWSPEGGSPAVRLLRSYLGGRVQVVARESPVEGLTVVVGNGFPGVREGRAQAQVREPVTVCAPAPPAPPTE